MKSLTGILKISTMSVALLTSTAIVASVAMSDVAYAGNGNGNNGNGNSGNAGGSSDKGNSGKSEASADKGKSTKSKGASVKREAKTKRANNPLKALGDLFKKKSDAPKAKSATRKSAVKTERVATKSAPKATPAPKPRGNPLAQALGVHPSELGALNAANASPTASPNSRVGKLAIYAGQVEATREKKADLIKAQELLDTLDAPERSGEEIDLALVDAETARTTRQDDLAGLLADLETAGGTDADIESKIEIASADIVALDDEIAALKQERSDGEAYESAAEDVAGLEEELAVQADAQRAALEAAANKEVTDAVEAAVQSLLGINQKPTIEDHDVLEEDIVSLD